MRVLIIGGVSFIGRAVTRELLAGGHEVAVFHRGATQPDGTQSALHIHGDRDQLGLARAQFQAFRPDVAIHMIAMTRPHGADFASALSGIAQRAVVISSQDVYRVYGRLLGTEPGPPDTLPVNEGSPLRERLYPYRGDKPRAEDDARKWMNHYDKIPVEQVVLSAPDLPCAVLRLPAVYGPNDQQRRFHAWLKHMDDGRPAILLDAAEARWRWTHGYVDDVAHAITLAALDPRSAGRVYNVGERLALSLEERVRAVAQAAGWHGQLALIPAGALPEPLRLGVMVGHDLISDTSRIRAELDYAELTSIEESYQRTIAWERENPQATDEPGEFDYAREDTILANLE
ncbi:MAG TPA: NAD-dependent epimerase/dehydratase family protein [Ktedonobacterales bacterium]